MAFIARAARHAAALAPLRFSRHLSTAAVREAYETLKALGGDGGVTLDFTNADVGVAVIRLSQPRHKNALTPAMMCDFADAVTALESFQGRAAILIGDGGNFCSGLDLKMKAMLEPAMGVAINSACCAESPHSGTSRSCLRLLPVDSRCSNHAVMP